jgi:hypothetical protein
VRPWRRTLTPKRGMGVGIRDVDELRSVHKDLQLSLMTCWERDAETPGQILHSPPSGAGTSSVGEILSRPEFFTARAEPIDLRGPHFQSCWGKRIRRLLLTMRQTHLKDVFEVRIREGQPPSGSLLPELPDDSASRAKSQWRTRADRLAPALLSSWQAPQDAATDR